MQRRLVTTVMLALLLGLGAIAAADEDESTLGALDSAGSLVEARATHTATLLPDGRVLIAGGKDWWDRNGSFGFIDIWEPATAEFIPAEGLAEPRGFHTATFLPDGRVILIGGDGASGTRALAEIWTPGATAPAAS